MFFKLTKMLKNKLGYYLFMTPNGELKGTSDITLAQQQGRLRVRQYNAVHALNLFAHALNLFEGKH